MTVELPPTGAPDVREHRRGLPTIALVPLAGATWWLVGFLWWGIELLGSNIMTVNGYPRAALPLLAASSTDSLIVGCGVGGVLAGLVALLGRGRRVARLAAVVAGVGLAMAAALVQSRAALNQVGTEAQTTDARVTGGLAVLVVCVTVVAVALGASSLAGRPRLGLALAAAAGAAPMWVFQLVSSISDTAGSSGSVGSLARWTGAVVLAGALVALGLRPAVRLVCWPAAVVLAWVVAPSVTASGYFATSLSRGPRSAASVREYLSAAGQVWRHAVEPGRRPLASWVFAVVVAGLLAWVLDRRCPRGEPSAGTTADPGLPTLVAKPVDRADPDSPSASWP